MQIKPLISRIDPEAARALVESAGRVFDALVIESERIQEEPGPALRDYPSAELSREAPQGGWISDSALRRAAQDISEAIAKEKWTEGFITAVRWMRVLG